MQERFLNGSVAVSDDKAAITMPETGRRAETGEMTPRQKIDRLLREGVYSCRELSQAVHQSEKEVLDHLEHLRASARARGLRLLIEPAVCRHCGFTFAKRTRLAKPGRCPECRRTGIEPPLYRIGEDDTCP